MASSTTPSLVAVFIISFCLISPFTSAHWKKHHHHHRPSIQNQLVFQICNKAPFRKLCLRTYASHPQTNDCTNIHGLAQIAVMGVREKVEATSLHFTNIVNGFPLPTLQQYLSGCSSNYLSVSKQLSLTVDASVGVSSMAQLHGSEVVTSLRLAMSKVSSCESGFSFDFLGKSAISGMNVELMHLCSNAIAIAMLLPN